MWSAARRQVQWRWADMPNNSMADVLGHTSQQPPVDSAPSASAPINYASKHRRASTSAVSRGRGASNHAAPPRRASAFTTPTPAARLLERFGITAADARNTSNVGTAASAQRRRSRRPSSALGGGREAAHAQSGSNHDAQQPSSINPFFDDLYERRPARPPAFSPAAPAWRPGGGGGGPRAAATATGLHSRSPQGGGSYVSHAAAATAARARATSRQVIGQGHYPSQSPAADGRDATASDTATTTTAVGSPVGSPASGIRRNSDITPPSRPSAPAARAPDLPRRHAAFAGAPVAAAGRTAQKTALTYSAWLETQTRGPAMAPPQWRNPSDRTASSGSAASTSRGPDATQTGTQSPGAPPSSGAVGASPRTPPPITAKPARSNTTTAAVASVGAAATIAVAASDDASSAYSTPTANSPAAASGPPAVARRLLLPSRSNSRELSFFDPGDTDSTGRSGNGSSGGGDGGAAIAAAGGGEAATEISVGFSRLHGFGSAESSSANLGTGPSITTITVGDRLRSFATPLRAAQDGGVYDSGDHGADYGSPAGDSGRLALPSSAAVVAAVGRLGVRGATVGGAAAAEIDGGSAAAAASQGKTQAERALSGPSRIRNSIGLRDSGAAAAAAAHSDGKWAAATAAHFHGYRGVRLHDYLHHQQQQLSGGDGIESGEVLLYTAGAGASRHPSERVEYGMSDMEHCGSEEGDEFERASIFLDDMVRQASVTGTHQLSPTATMRRGSSRSGGRRSSTAATTAEVRPQHSTSGRHFRSRASSGSQPRGPTSRPASGLSERAVEAAGGGGIAGARRSTLGDGHSWAEEMGLLSPRTSPTPSQTSATPVGSGSSARRKVPEGSEIQTLSSMRPAGAAAVNGGGSAQTVSRHRGNSGDGGGEDADSSTPQAPWVGAPAAAAAAEAETAPAIPAAHGSAAVASQPAVPPPLPPVSKIRSFRLRITSELVSDCDDGADRSSEAVTTAIQGRASEELSRGVRDADAATGSRVNGAKAPATPGSQLALRGQQGAEPLAAPPSAGPALGPRPPLPPSSFQNTSPGCEAPAQQQLNNQPDVTMPQSQPISRIPPGTRQPQQQHQQPLQAVQATADSPAAAKSGSSCSGFGDDRPTGRSVSAPRASTISSGAAAAPAAATRGSGAWGPPPRAARAPSRQDSLSSLSRELWETMRSRCGVGGTSTGQLLLPPPTAVRGSLAALSSPTAAKSELIGGGSAFRGSISGASNFSALSGPQVGVMYNYPSHGYMERAAEYGRWEAAMLYDLDLYSSMQIQGFPSPDEYDDPSYLARSQSGLASVPYISAAAAARPVMPPPQGAVAGTFPAGGGVRVLQGASAPENVRRHGAPRRAMSASAAMLAAAAANTVAAAAASGAAAAGAPPGGSGPGPGSGATRGSVVPSRMMVRSSRSWSPLRFSSTASSLGPAPGSPRARTPAESVLAALDQILEEESCSRISGGAPPEQAAGTDADAPSSSLSGGGGGSSGSATGGLGSTGSFTGTRELSLAAWPSFKRLSSSCRRSGSSDGRLIVNTDRNLPGSGSRRGSTDNAWSGAPQLPLPPTQPPPQTRGALPTAQPQTAPPLRLCPEDAAQSLDGPMRSASPPRQPTPSFLSKAEEDDGSGGLGHNAFTNPLAAMATPQSSPHAPDHSGYHRVLAGTEPLHAGAGALLSHGNGHAAVPQGDGGAVGSPVHGRSPRGNGGGPPPHVPPTIPEEVLSHPLARLSLTSPYSSAAGSAVAGVAQTQRWKEQQQQGRHQQEAAAAKAASWQQSVQQQQQQQHHQLQPKGSTAHGCGAGTALGSLARPAQGASVAAPAQVGLPTSRQLPLYGVYGVTSAGVLTPDAIATATAENVVVAGPDRTEAAPGLLVPRAAPWTESVGPGAMGSPLATILLAPSGSLGSSSSSSSDPRAAFAASAVDGDGWEAAPRGAPVPAVVPVVATALLCHSHAAAASDWLQRAGKGPASGGRSASHEPTQQQTQQHRDRGWGLVSREGVMPAGQEPQLAGYCTYPYPPRAAAPYPPPSLESIQRLLDSDLPSPAIAAAVAVLAGSLSHSGARPQNPGPTAPSPPAPPVEPTRPSCALRRADPAARASGHAGAAVSPLGAGKTPAPAPATEARAASTALGASTHVAAAGAAALTVSPYASAGGWGAAAYLDQPAQGIGGTQDTGIPHDFGGRRGPMTRSYMALLTLAGERGMPPKPLQEEGEPLGPPKTTATDGPAVTDDGLAESGRMGVGAEICGQEGVSRRGGLGHLVDGPLGRAVRLLAQSMLIVLAGAAGATAAASSANAIFIRPEDMPYEHGTSIYYTKYPRHKRLTKTAYR